MALQDKGLSLSDEDVMLVKHWNSVQVELEKDLPKFSQEESMYLGLWDTLSSQRFLSDSGIGPILLTEAKVILKDLGYKKKQRIFLYDRLMLLDREYVNKVAKDRERQRDKSKTLNTKGKTLQ